MAGIRILSERLKEVRESLNMNQADFAKLIGVTQQSLSSYEKCVSKPTLDVAIRIADKCDLSLSWLCGLSDRPSNNKVFKTYTDIIDIFFDIMNIAHLDVYSTKVKAKNVNMQDVTMWGISFTDKYLNEFIADWQKMRTLYINQTIDEEVYDLWREKTIKKYNFPIIPEITERKSDISVLNNTEKNEYLKQQSDTSADPTPQEEQTTKDPEILAAHARTDIEQTPEGLQHDLDIMNDDSQWK